MAAVTVAVVRLTMPRSEQLPVSSKKEAPLQGLLICQEGTRQENETVTFYHDAAVVTLSQASNLLDTTYHTSGEYHAALRCNKNTYQWQ